MLSSIKHSIRKAFAATGLDVRVASKMMGADPLQDIKKLHDGKTMNTIIDIGANVGQSALRFHRAFPEASIHSFEPVTASYQSGKKNVENYPSIAWHHLALGNATKNIVFYSSGTSQMNSLTNASDSSSNDKGERNEVEMVRFDEFYTANKLNHIDLLKTDTEGLDLDVLEGAAEVLKGQRVSYILCEVGFSRGDTSHSFFPPIADYLEQFGYRLVCFYGISDINHFKEWHVTYADALFTISS